MNEPSENSENVTPTLTLIPWLLAAKNDNRLLQHRTMFRASNVKNAFSLASPIQYWPTSPVLVQSHGLPTMRRRRHRRRYRCRRATVFGNQMIFAARVPPLPKFRQPLLQRLPVLRTSRESGMMPGARRRCRCTERCSRRNGSK